MPTICVLGFCAKSIPLELERTACAGFFHAPNFPNTEVTESKGHLLVPPSCAGGPLLYTRCPRRPAAAGMRYMQLQ